MKAGKLDRKITLERETEIVDEFGTVARGWTLVARDVPAQLVQASTDEFLTTFGEAGTIARVFRIRHRDGVLLTDRVTHNGRAFNIVELTEIGRRVGLELRCEATT
ncbi:MAG: phage head closure protein [Aurantimonas coralicida]